VRLIFQSPDWDIEDNADKKLVTLLDDGDSTPSNSDVEDQEKSDVDSKSAISGSPGPPQPSSKRSHPSVPCTPASSVKSQIPVSGTKCKALHDQILDIATEDWIQRVKIVEI